MQLPMESVAVTPELLTESASNGPGHSILPQSTLVRPEEVDNFATVINSVVVSAEK